MKEVIAYACNWCPRSRKAPFWTKGGVKQHEANCMRNPAQRACITCKFMKIEEETVDTQYGERVDQYVLCLAYDVQLKKYTECVEAAKHAAAQTEFGWNGQGVGPAEAGFDPAHFTNNCPKWEAKEAA